jgi:hypothetical protein
MTETRADLIHAVRQHALALYEQGWDIVEECYTDDDLDDLIGTATTVKAAIAAVAATLGLEAERLEGFIVTNRDVDGTSRTAYQLLSEAIEHFEEMSGHELTGDLIVKLAYGETVTRVGGYGNTVSLTLCGNGTDDRVFDTGHQREYNPDNYRG